MKPYTETSQFLIPYTKNFTKETLLGRLEAIEFDLKNLGELAKVEKTFSALIVTPFYKKYNCTRRFF